MATTDMAVVVPVAAAGSPDHGPRGIYDTMGHSEEAQGWRTDTGTEPTTSADNTPTVAAGDTPIPQTGEEPVTVRDSETTTIVDPTGPLISQTEWELSPDGKSLDVLIYTQLNLTVDQVSNPTSAPTDIRTLCTRCCSLYLIILSHVMLPLYDDLVQHWLLMVVDLRRRQFAVYDSLPPITLTNSTNEPHW
ncbi:hypothetical protein Cgig2_021007 [Carnegiea gigantea]|uniref:Ubiquitin-like protease family profile domain-containing protein n=1 Tax=Carnegiea gigantea TaxID=171969 RepID=A0A9Q1K911_9CARY|nr:hypothetical protein Cgig2_021007 [Carnegiea gigantea]